MHEDRIIELETRLAFQEDQLDQLNSIISTQQLELVELRKIIKFLHGQIEALYEANPPDGNDKSPEGQEQPPHY